MIYSAAWYLGAAMFAGLWAILWGIYGDLLAERFEARKALRSILFACLYAVAIFLRQGNYNLLLVGLGVIALERLATEIWKGLIREEDQSKYKIPSGLFRGVHRAVRRVAGWLLLAAAFFAAAYVSFSWGNLYFVFAPGFLVAFGGAFKDAPFEGFNFKKFLRSPLFGAIAGGLLYLLFPAGDSFMFALAVFGGERVLSETWKKILLGRVPGKFREEAIDEEWRRRRRRLLLPYALILIGIAVLYFV